MDKPTTSQKTTQTAEVTGVYPVPVGALMRYLKRTLTLPFHEILQREYGYFPRSLDTHLIIRHGLRRPLHLNLGIPGIEKPPCPIEENSAVLYAACSLRAPSVPTVLSGQLELAVRHKLMSRKALINLRKEIRATV